MHVLREVVVQGGDDDALDRLATDGVAHGCRDELLFGGTCQDEFANDKAGMNLGIPGVIWLPIHANSFVQVAETTTVSEILVACIRESGLSGVPLTLNRQRAGTRKGWFLATFPVNG